MDTIASLSSSPNASLDPTSANSKVLGNQDVLSLIFSYLVEYKPNTRLSLGTRCWPRAGLADLLQVGLTCRAFVEPMLDLLWYEVDSLLPLLRLISKVTMEEGVYTSSSVILPADLQTFQSYSSRIRHIHLYSFKEKVSNHIYSSITRYLFSGNSGFFPALRCLGIHTFSNISEENLLILPLITPSSLSTVNILHVTGAIEIHLASFLSGIAHSSSTSYPTPSLLRLAGTLTSSTLSQIGYFKKVTTLEFFLADTDFPFITLAAISKLPFLQVFKLALATRVIGSRFLLDAKSSAQPTVCVFPSLQFLEVRSNATVVLDILQSIYGEQILRVTLGLAAHATNDAVKACINQCMETAPHMLLYSMHVHGPVLQLPQDLFARLPTNYGQLRSLTIEAVAIPIQHFLDLFDRARVGLLWSSLENLKLQVNQIAVPRRNWLAIDDVVPLASLAMLAAACPRLLTLDLYLYYPRGKGDEDNKLLESYVQNTQPTDHKLANLKIQFLDPFATVTEPGDIMGAITVSRFIDHVFPNLQNVDISDRFGDVRKEWYSGIKAMITNYRDVRGKNAFKGEPIIPS